MQDAQAELAGHRIAILSLPTQPARYPSGCPGAGRCEGPRGGVQASPGHRPGRRPGVNLSVMDLTRKRGRYCRLLADASTNLEAAYLAGERNGAKELVLAVSDLQAARQVRDQGSR
jgi:hypothetical protein